MSGEGFPFQHDALALARWDYCLSPYAIPETNDPLSCSLRARQCGSHIASTGNRAWAGRASIPLSELLQPGVVNGWAGGSTCLQSDTQGACGLLLSERYGEDLWNAVGKARAQQAYAQVGNVKTPLPPAISTMHPTAFGSTKWLIDHYYR